MKAPDFRYACPASVEEAVALLSDPELDATPLAGGQSLIPMMNFRMAAPGMLVDLNRIPALSGIREEGGHVVIGAMTRYRELMESPLVARALPLMAMALPHVAHPAIRNRGTLGGSIALADPAAEMPAVLLALGGAVELTGPGGTRRIDADDFFLGLYETARAPDELVTALVLPVTPRGTRLGFHEFARRHGDYAMAGVAVAGQRAVFFGVADRPLRLSGVEAALAAEDIDGAVAALAEAPFDGDLNATAETKRHLAGVALRRALAEGGAR